VTALASTGDERRGVTVAIVAQGNGFDATDTRAGYGIRHSITTRMADVRGLATMDSRPRQGTRVDLRWPG
jgi:signal transduction histidine kinase